MFEMFTRFFLKMRLGGKRAACPLAWLTGQVGSGHRQGHQQQGFQMSYRARGGPRASQRFRSSNSSIAQETVFSANAPSLRAGRNNAYRVASSSGPAYFCQVQEQLLVLQVFKEWDVNGQACASHPLRVGPGFVGPMLIQFRNKGNSTTSSVQKQGQRLGRDLYMAETQA